MQRDPVVGFSGCTRFRDEGVGLKGVRLLKKKGSPRGYGGLKGQEVWGETPPFQRLNRCIRRLARQGLCGRG